MTLTDKLERGLRHPVTVVSGLVGAFAAVLDPNLALAVGGALWAQIGTIFTAASIGAFTLAEHVPDLEPIKPALVSIAIVAGGIYLVKLGDRVLDAVENRL